MSANRDQVKPICIGIDATNIRIGGGVTHLLEFLSAIDPAAMKIDKVYVWAGAPTLQSLPQASWLIKVNPASLNKGLAYRIFWQFFCLSRAARNAQCDVLLVPGGSYFGSFSPAVTMSQNLFPFEWAMISQARLSLRSLKLILLRWTQSRSFQRAAGVIFLTKYAQNAVLKVTGSLKAQQAVIAHGLNPRFAYDPKVQLPIEQYSEAKPYRLIYISTLDVYKNQAQVVLAADLLRRKGYPVTLTLIGPAAPGALKLLQQLQKKIDPKGEWLRYLGQLPYASLHLEYQKADLSIYASSCETFGMTVLENMSVGLPIACSSESSMHEVLEGAGLYFDPHNPTEIAAVVEQYLLNPALREEKQKMAYALSVKYSWKRCAQETVAFLRSVIHP